MSAITSSDREVEESWGREPSRVGTGPPAEQRVQARSGSDSVDLSNGDPEYVMLWGADNADPRPRGDRRR